MKSVPRVSIALEADECLTILEVTSMYTRFAGPLVAVAVILSVSTTGCSSRVHGSTTDAMDAVDAVADGRADDQSGDGLGGDDTSDFVAPDQGGDMTLDLKDVGPTDLTELTDADVSDQLVLPDTTDIDSDVDSDIDLDDDTSDTVDIDTPDLAQPKCGDGVVEGTEQCDELDEADGDGCDTDCTYTEILKVEAGYNFACALIEGGRVRCWGQNHVGQLGLGHTSAIGDDEFPSSAGDVSLPIAAKDITLGDAHSCILTVDDDIMCWGMGASGRLGYGSLSNIGDDEFLTNLTAVPVGGKVAEVRAGGSHTCARLVDGTLRCWGAGAGGQLGYGNSNTIGDNETPASAGNVPLGAAVLTMQTGIGQSCAITADNAVRCWGTGFSGSLGYGNTNTIGDDEPVSVAGTVSCLPQGAAPGTKPIAVATSFFSCALYSSGEVLCWGPNSVGELGQGNTTSIGDNEVPSVLPPIALDGKAVAITIGDSHACALLDDHKMRCWGSNQLGELGLGTTIGIGDDELPNAVAPVSFDEDLRYIDAGSLFTCAITTTNELRCWGKNMNGQLGQGHEQPLPDGVLPKDLAPVQLF